MQRSHSILRKSNCTQYKSRNGHPPTQRIPGSTIRNRVGRPPQSSSRSAVRPGTRGRTLLQLVRYKSQLGRDDLLPSLLRIRTTVVRGEGHPIQVAACGQLNQSGPTCGKHARRFVRRGRHDRRGVRLQGPFSISSKVVKARVTHTTTSITYVELLSSGQNANLSCTDSYPLKIDAV